jgi:thiamine biosynthesis lipoprotein
MNRKQIVRNLIGLALILWLGIGGYMRAMHVRHPILQGSTMGTSYSVTITGYVKRNRLEALSDQIEGELAEINRQMSTWDTASEISKFNKSDESGPFLLSEAFHAVMIRSLELSRITGGTFDPTLNPLMNLWGFGSKGSERTVPTDADIAKAKERTGWNKLWFDEDANLWKAIADLELDLGAVAKGYGVDMLTRLLTEEGYENWFAEIGGEVVVKGKNPDGVPWRIGIQYPTSNPMDERLQGIVNLTEGAVATSGDYRNYIRRDGVVYSHILDPHSGHTALSDTASATVIAPTCMDADGIATALFVMGAEEGLAWVEQQPDVEAMFLVRGENGEIFEKFSSGFIAAAGYSSSR